MSPPSSPASSPGGGSPPTAFDPTSAFARSTGLSLLVLLLAAALARPDLALLAVPLVVHAAWGWWRRPDPSLPDPTVVTVPQRVGITEGEVVDLGLHVPDLPAHHWLSAQWTGLVQTTWDPPLGAVVDSAPDGTVTVGLEPARWGRYETGHPGLQVVDSSGSWRAELRPASSLVTVRPLAATLHGASGVARPIGLTGAHTSSVRGDGTQLADIREYRTGDRLRRINWRVTSRTQRLHVTSTFTERDTDVLVVTDTLRDLPDPHQTSTSLDATVRAVAAISQHYIGFGDRVAVHDLGRRLGHVRAATGPRQMRLILEVLSRTVRELPDHVALRPVASVRSGTLVFFCSPLLDDRIIDQLVRLRQLGGEVIAVDTMPAALGTIETLRGSRNRAFLDEAWVLRRLQRDEVLAGVERLGIPVTAWRGPTSLGSVLLAMEAARSAPRRTVGR
ncbi:DUF58 domain-containing protein [Aestuariimicrobium sp. T2.26MG-19.2B]|uniref:DUF58 domain-containing protein n=1 Tax=Aestuariimicrobium sp. T2.26MG-19.2B TaxID=3040679 RepID=UPI002477C38E|nr:DUF58 domain-containing protein [Aestuariimicrobium sp. T2.26MG-19.2B]CAI9405011.1 hypothetical protein AESSP_01326 [Aestuariimicrobium sp. T2.26MG-19.2B]